MIRYALKCSDNHSFESWFASAEAFELLRDSRRLTCPKCGTIHVDRAIMAPNVATSEKAAAHVAAAPDGPDGMAVETGTPAPRDADALFSAMRKELEANSEYVGDRFTNEARAMHDGKMPKRNIYGEAKLTEAKALVDDGVPVVPIPFKPKRKLN